MKVTISTNVKGFYDKVYRAFDLKLFEFLKPKGARMEIVEFTGSQKGDKVHIRFTSPIKADWISEIIEDHKDEQTAFFVDKGTVLPWPLKEWRHKHEILNTSDESSTIIDHIQYKTSNVIFDLLFWPVMYIAFSQRKPLYRKYFKQF